MQELAAFLCAQHRVYHAFEVVAQGGTTVSVTSTLSACNTFRRDFLTSIEQCNLFCPAVRRACATTLMPPSYCEDYCRSAFEFEYCQVLEVSGVDHSWPIEVRDVNNNYRLETEQELPILRNGRPSYRSIPARRGFGSRTAKLNYFLYSTHVAGFTEWLFDSNDIESDGAAGFLASANFLPQTMSADWSFWREEQKVPTWSSVRLSIVCQDDILTSQISAAAASSRCVNAQGMALLVLAMVSFLQWWQGGHHLPRRPSG